VTVLVVVLAGVCDYCVKNYDCVGGSVGPLSVTALVAVLMTVLGN
jgi:hypothetical protein